MIDSLDMSIENKNPTGLYHLDAAYHKAGDGSHATEALNRALALSQPFQEAEEARKLIAAIEQQKSK